MKELYGREYTSADMINIPLMISVPGLTPGAQLEQIGGQVDILPTIAGLTGVSLEDQLHFGQDLLHEGGNLLPERYYLPSGSVLNDASLFIPAKGYGDGTHYSLADAGRQDAGKQQMAVSSEEKLQFLTDAEKVPPDFSTTNNGEVSSSRFITKEQYTRALDLVHLSNSYLSQLPDRKHAK